MEQDQNAKALAKAAPKLNKSDLKAMNDLFPSYIFRHRKTREIWTTCCGRHSVLPKDHEIMTAMHMAEPKPEPWFGCHMGAMSAPVPDNKPKPQKMACPYCGKKSPVKELGRTGKRDNLCAYRRAVALRWHGGALWAVAYDLAKRYPDESALTAMPSYSICAVYRFTLGLAEHAFHNWRGAWTDYIALHGPLTAKYRFYEPFRYNTEYGMGYAIVGLGAINKSPFRWCGIIAFAKISSSLMRYLALCTAYPRQVEMLTKAGLTEAVKDFVDRKCKNARVMCWETADPLKAFGVTRQELTAFLSSDKSISVLYRYKQLKKAGVPTSFECLQEIKRLVGNIWFDRIAAKMGKYHLSWPRLQGYLQREIVQIKKKSRPDIMTAAGLWSDYIDAAKVLGLDLTNQVVLLPKCLPDKHDTATRAAGAILESRRSDDTRKQEIKRLRSLTRKYTYTDGRWLIRPPLGAKEIVAEGKALKHCVGGYADRHISGATTILFLRDRTRPGRSLVTIEMRGAEIVQIHGWDDERSACKDNPKRISPRKIYAEFLDGWLAWVADGSKRDKNGRPKIPKKKEEGAA